MSPFTRLTERWPARERVVTRNRPRRLPCFPVGGGGMKTSLRSGALFAALLAAFAPFSPDEARAQAVCTPTQTVEPPAGSYTRYTTVLVCANTTAAAGAADYRHLHYNQGPSGTGDTANPEDRDTTLANNHPSNDVSLTIGSGVVFTAGGGVNMRLVEVDGAIALWRGGAKTVVVEDGAVINYERVPREGGGNYAFLSWTDWLRNHAGIYAASETGKGGVTVRHHGVINLDFDIQQWYWGAHYGATVGAGISVLVTDEVSGPTRDDEDVLVELGATGVIRQRAGSDDGMSGIAAINYAEDGDVTVHLAEGSLIDLTPRGGVAVHALLDADGRGNNAGVQTGDVVVRAAGTIRNAVKRRTASRWQGSGIRATNDGLGTIRVASSGTVESWQALAIYASAGSDAGEQHDDPATEEVEGHLIDVTAGKVHTRGGTAVNAESYSADSAFTVRVGEGATVRAEFDAGPDAPTPMQLASASAGARYVYPGNIYGWRQVDTDGDGTDDALEPVVNAIRVVGGATSEGVADRVVVHGRVEAVGGKADVDPAILMNDGGVVVVGATGRVVAEGSGLAIASGNPPPATPPEDYEPEASDLDVTVAGRVTGDILVRDDGDLSASVSGTVARGDLRTMGAGDLAATVSGMVDGDVQARGGGALTLNVMEGGTVAGDVSGLGAGEHVVTVSKGGTVTGTVHLAASTVRVDGTAGRVRFDQGGTVTVGSTGRITGIEVEGRTEAIRSEAGALVVSVAAGGEVKGELRALGGGTLKLNVMEGGVVPGTVHDPAGTLTVAGEIGRLLYTNGGTVTVARTGSLTGITVEAGTLDLTVSGRVAGDLRAPSGGTLKLAVREGGKVPGTVHDPVGPLTVAGSIGRLLYTNGGAVTVAATGALTGVEVGGKTEALRSEAGDLDVSVSGRVTGDLRAQGGGNLDATVSGTVDGDIQAQGGGALTLDLKAGGAVTGTVHDPVGPLMVAGRIGRLLYTNGGTVTVARTGALTGVEVEGETDAICSEGGTQAICSEAGTLDLTVSGRVAGDLRAPSGGTLKLAVREGGKVPGTVHDPVGPLTVAGEIGRLLYTNGGTVTVARTGALTGIEAEGETQAIRSEAGTLDLTVSGRVAGDHLRAPSGGTLKLAVREGGAVPGTVHDPVGPLTVAGSIGRLLYTNGGTVTVAATGALTGVEVEDRTEALRSEAGNLALSVAGMGTVTGDVRARGDGDLRATVSGTVDGDIQAQGDGALTLDLKAGGAVAGTVHDPAGPLTVAGSIGRLLYTSGGAVTVAATGRLTGVEVGGKTEALRSEAGDLSLTVDDMGEVTGDVQAPGGDLALSVAGMVTGDVFALGDGDLSATISGTLTGDVFGLGAGEHVVTVSNGGTVTGTVHLAASTVSVHGTAGRVLFDQGGTVTVGSTGRITGVEVEGRTAAIWNEAGDLVVGVAGRVTGDVIGLGSRPARVTTGPGSRVEGSIDVAGAGSEVRADGTVEGNVRFRRGGTVTAGPDGKVEGRVSSDRGELVAVAEQKPDETEAEAVERAFPGELVEEGGTPTVQIRKEGEPARSVGALDTMDALVDGAWDVGMKRTESGAFRGVARKLAPRSRVYEALPSVVLGLNGLRGFRERMAAPRSAKGGWARVERFQGKWKADASASQKESGVGLKYRHRRHGVEVGLGGGLGEEARIGASLHHRRGTAKVTEGGDVELYGTGAGVSGTWTRDELYVDAQAAVTWYEADLGSSRRGVLKKDLSGHGHALGVEAGRRVALERLAAGLVLTPRAGLVHSRVSMGAFSDKVGARVSVDDARSLRGRAGVDVEAKREGSPQSRMFASLEVEHEFSTDRKVRVSGTELKSEAEAMWLRLGLNGVYAWDEGRYTVQGGMSYATSGGSHELGGGLSLNLRF